MEISDYSLSISSNGGNANEAYITSLTTLFGDPISINESDIKINIDYPDIPSGVEEVTIGPASVSSIFNSVGIPLLNVEGISILLEDASSPIITSTVPADNAEEVPENLNISLTFSEEVFYNNEAINNENASNCFKLEVLETGEELGYVLSNSNNSIFTLNPENIELNFLLGEKSYELGFIEKYGEYISNLEILCSGSCEEINNLKDLASD